MGFQFSGLLLPTLHVFFPLLRGPAQGEELDLRKTPAVPHMPSERPLCCPSFRPALWSPASSPVSSWRRHELNLSPPTANLGEDPSPL